MKKSFFFFSSWIPRLMLMIVALTFATALPQVSIFTSQEPVSAGNDAAYELGTKFVSSQSTEITALRFYKMPGETGPHTGKLWSSTGDLIASVTFTNETASGWQVQPLASPVLMVENTVYVVSVNTNSFYAYEHQGLAVSVSNQFLSTVADNNNGVFSTVPGSFPQQSYLNSNYFVDIVANSNLTSIFTDQLPVGEFTDGPYEMGVKFRVTRDSRIRYIRYYKTPGETGAHTGRLWNGSGIQMATAVFTNETASGWQTAPVTGQYLFLGGGQVYTVSVNSNTAYGASAPQALANSVANGIVYTVADNNNGVYSGSPNTQGQFPTFSFNNTNYFRDVVVEPFLPPSAVYPVDGSANQSIEPVITWTPVPGANEYTLQLSTDSTFATSIFLQGSIFTTSRAFTGLLNDQYYYWRVSAHYEPFASDWSETFSFKTAPHRNVVLSWPTGGAALFSSPASFSWSVPTGGTGWKYDLILSTTPGFTSPTTISDLATNVTSVPGLLPGTLYYWKVRLKTSEGAVVSYSPVESFITFGQAVVPQLSYPNGGTLIYNLSPTLYWYLNTASTGLVYELELREGGAGSLNGTPTHTGISTTYFAVSDLQPGQLYSWRVRSVSGSVTSAWSVIETFNTVQVTNVIVPIPSWPAGYPTIYSTATTLYWYLGASGTGLTYNVELVEGLGTPFTGVPTHTGITTLSLPLSGLTPGADYKWKVQSTDGNLTSVWSNEQSFKIYTLVPSAIVVPFPSWPIGGALVYASNYNLNWYTETSNIGITFDVEYGTSALTGTPTVTGINATTLEIANLQSATTYFWRVRSNNGSGHSNWSVTESFTTIGTTVAAVTPYPSWPIGGATVYTLSPTLYWYLGASSLGLTYDLQYSVNSDMSDAVTLTGLTEMNAELSNLNPGTTYYWRVKSFDGQVYSSPSTVASFVTFAGTSAVVPMGGSPVNGEIITTNSPLVSWYLPTQGEISDYQVQISTQPDMSDAVTFSSAQQSLTVGELNSGITYYWRVRSANLNGEFSAFSEKEAFTVNSPTGIKGIAVVPAEFAVKQNFPNPFNPITVIEFSVPKQGYYTLDVYNIMGEKVASLISGTLSAGDHKAVFNGKDMISGVYFYKLSGETSSIVRKMTLIK